MLLFIVFIIVSAPLIFIFVDTKNKKNAFKFALYYTLGIWIQFIVTLIINK